MLRIHRPIVFWIGTVVLVISVIGYQNNALQYELLLTLADGFPSAESLYVFNDPSRYLKDGLTGFDNYAFYMSLYTGGIVLGVLTILYGLIPNKPK